jgi:hypothetical protein
LSVFSRQYFREEASVNRENFDYPGNTYTFEFGMVGVPGKKKRNCNKASRLLDNH